MCTGTHFLLSLRIELELPSLGERAKKDRHGDIVLHRLGWNLHTRAITRAIGTGRSLKGPVQRRRSLTLYLCEK